MNQFKGHTGPWPLTCALKYRNVRETESCSKFSLSVAIKTVSKNCYCNVQALVYMDVLIIIHKLTYKPNFNVQPQNYIQQETCMLSQAINHAMQQSVRISN